MSPLWHPKLKQFKDAPCLGQLIGQIEYHDLFFRQKKREEKKIKKKNLAISKITHFRAGDPKPVAAWEIASLRRSLDLSCPCHVTSCAARGVETDFLTLL